MFLNVSYEHCNGNISMQEKYTKICLALSRGSNPRAKRWDYYSVDKIEPLRPVAFVLKLLRDSTRNRALTDDIARTINILFPQYSNAQTLHLLPRQDCLLAQVPYN